MYFWSRNWTIALILGWIPCFLFISPPLKHVNHIWGHNYIGIWDMCRGTIINISDASHQEVQHLTLWQSYNMDTSITLEIFWLYTKARKGWQIDNWCLHDKKSGHKWTYINSFYKKSCSLPDSRPALPCPWTCRAAPWWRSPTWWCLRASPRCLPTSALLQLCPWWYPVSRSCQTKKEWMEQFLHCLYVLDTTWRAKVFVQLQIWSF